MTEAYIVDVLRTPTGRRRGMLAEIHPADLGAHAIGTLVGRNNIPPEEYDDVIFGCVDTVGPQAGNIARISWLAANLPLHIPGVTIDRRCGSSQQAVHFAAQAIMSGMQDVVVAGGVQHVAGGYWLRSHGRQSARPSGALRRLETLDRAVWYPARLTIFGRADDCRKMEYFT